jgi:hypothetical protein
VLRQVSTFISNLTSEYTNFLNFIQTAPSFFTALAADAVLINRQINAVRSKPCLRLQPAAAPRHSRLSIMPRRTPGHADDACMRQGSQPLAVPTMMP